MFLSFTSIVFITTFTAASLLVDWNITVISKSEKSIGIIWSQPTNLISGGIRFYVAFARRINSSSEPTGEIVAQNTTESEITGLKEYVEYNVGVVVVDGDGIPFKSNEVLVTTDEGGKFHYKEGLIWGAGSMFPWSQQNFLVFSCFLKVFILRFWRSLFPNII